MTAIFKILIPEQWAQFEKTQIFKGAPIDLSDGYIHFSTAAQAQETADKHFTGVDAIIMARVDVDSLPESLAEALKWETSRGGDVFPHLLIYPIWRLCHEPDSIRGHAPDASHAARARA